MIQRKQTIFLLLAFIAFVVCAFCDQTFVSLCGWVSGLSLLTLGDVFLYKNRKRQSLLCVVLMALAVVYYIALAVFNNQQGGMLQLTWPMALPAVAVIFLFLAYKGIMHDEKLVRSLDRIR